MTQASPPPGPGATLMRVRYASPALLRRLADDQVRLGSLFVATSETRVPGAPIELHLSVAGLEGSVRLLGTVAVLLTSDPLTGLRIDVNDVEDVLGDIESFLLLAGAMLPDNVVQRGASRIKVRLRFDSADELQELYEREILRGEMFLFAEDPRPPGSQVELSLVIPESAKTFVLVGEVSHTIYPEGDAEDTPGMAVRLTNMTAALRHEIESFLQGSVRRPSSEVSAATLDVSRHDLAPGGARSNQLVSSGPSRGQVASVPASPELNELTDGLDFEPSADEPGVRAPSSFDWPLQPSPVGPPPLPEEQAAPAPAQPGSAPDEGTQLFDDASATFALEGLEEAAPAAPMQSAVAEPTWDEPPPSAEDPRQTWSEPAINEPSPAEPALPPYPSSPLISELPPRLAPPVAEEVSIHRAHQPETWPREGPGETNWPREGPGQTSVDVSLAASGHTAPPFSFDLDWDQASPPARGTAPLTSRRFAPEPEPPEPPPPTELEEPGDPLVLSALDEIAFAEDRRDGGRMPARVEVKLRPTDLRQFRELYTKDISRGGVFVYSDTPPPVGTAVEVLLYVPGAIEPFSFLGSVIHLVGAHDLRGPSDLPGMGIRFEHIEDAARLAIESIISRVTDAVPSPQPQPSFVESPLHLAAPSSVSGPAQAPLSAPPPTSPPIATATRPQQPYPTQASQTAFFAPSAAPPVYPTAPSPAASFPASPPPVAAQPPPPAAAPSRSLSVERRSHPREPQKSQLVLRYFTMSEFRDAYRKDIARGGAFLPTDDAFELRSLIDVVVIPPGTTRGVTLRSEVVHAVPAEPGRPGTGGIGVQFTDLNAKKKEAFEAYISGAGEAVLPDDEEPGAERREGRKAPRKGGGRAVVLSASPDRRAAADRKMALPPPPVVERLSPPTGWGAQDRSATPSRAQTVHRESPPPAARRPEAPPPRAREPAPAQQGPPRPPPPERRPPEPREQPFDRRAPDPREQPFDRRGPDLPREPSFVARETFSFGGERPVEAPSFGGLPPRAPALAQPREPAQRPRFEESPPSGAVWEERFESSFGVVDLGDESADDLLPPPPPPPPPQRASAPVVPSYAQKKPPAANQDELDRLLDLEFADDPGQPIDFDKIDVVFEGVGDHKKPLPKAVLPGAPATAKPPARVRPSALTAAEAQELLATLESALRRSYYDALGVKPNAGRAQIDEAVEARTQAFRENTYGSLEPSAARILGSGRERLERVAATLRDPESRASYECTAGILLELDEYEPGPERDARMKVRAQFRERFAQEFPDKVRKAEDYFRAALDELRGGRKQAALEFVKLALAYFPLSDRYLELMRKIQPR